jgi:hypothetical protein
MVSIYCAQHNTAAPPYQDSLSKNKASCSPSLKGSALAQTPNQANHKLKKFI